MYQTKKLDHNIRIFIHGIDKFNDVSYTEFNIIICAIDNYKCAIEKRCTRKHWYRYCRYIVASNCFTGHEWLL